MHGIDLTTLAIFPSDEEIQRIAIDAAQEADSLVKLLGVNPKQLWHCRAANLIPMLPGINMWFNLDAGDESLSEDCDEAQELQNLIDQHLLALTCASLAATTDDMIKV